MRLRVSGQQTGNFYDLRMVMGTDVDDAGFPHGPLLNKFTEAICARNLEHVSNLRDDIINVMGEEAMVDAAATIAAFNAYPRMANATGIPIEEVKRGVTAELREELGLEIFDNHE